jgi:hypothetical protein
MLSLFLRVEFVIAGWTPLHHAALLSPPTVISHLMTRGCSPFSVTRRNLTALDIVTGHTIMPGREDVALLLEESMRGDGWTGGRMARKRKVLEERIKEKGKQQSVRDSVAKMLSIDQRWWGSEDSDSSSINSDVEEEDENQETIYVSASKSSDYYIFTDSFSRHHLWISHQCLSSHHRRFLKYSTR